MGYQSRKHYWSHYERQFRSIRISASLWDALRRVARGTGKTLRLTADEFIDEGLEARGIPNEPDSRSPAAIDASMRILTRSESPRLRV